MFARPHLLWLGVALCVALAGCTSGGGGAPYVVPWDTEPVGTFDVTPDDGGTFVVDGGALDGVRVTVPAGAVAFATQITVGTAPSAPAMDPVALLETSPAGMASMVDRTLALVVASTTDELYHPLVHPAAALGADFTAVGPAIALEPTGATFDAPVVVDVPLATLGIDDGGDAEELVALITAPGPGGELVWEVIDTLEIADGAVRVAVDHFSVIRYARAIGWRFASAVVRPVMTLPTVPSMSDGFVREMVCSGIEPRLDADRIPWGPDLINYLMNPVLSEADSTNPFIRYWHERGVPGDLADPAGFEARLTELGFVSPHQADIEAWLRAQPDDSVTVEQLFGQAYRLADGDWYQATLLCHNTLRGLQYGTDVGNRVDPSIQDPMLPLVDVGDERGHRYHLFGMMLWGMAHGARSTRHLPFELGDTLRWYSQQLTVYLEEAIVSGDLLTDPHEAAFDLEGFETGNEFIEKVFSRSLSELRDSDFTLEPCGDLAVSIAADPTNPDVGEYVLFTSDVTGGEPPYLYTWTFGDGATSSLGEDTHAYQAEGAYTVAVRVEDGLGDVGEATLDLRVGTLPTNSEYLVWYTGNVRCWDAPYIEVGQRPTFESERPICSYSGGGTDCDTMVERVLMAEPFEDYSSAKTWACSQFTAWSSHAWCGAHYWIGDQPFRRPAALGCDFSDLPERPAE